MKMRAFLMVAVLSLLAWPAGDSCSQEENGGDERGPRGGLQSVSTEQKTAAKNALSSYNASSLSADDAKAIHKAMRNIGIHGGPAEDDLLRSIGFDPETLKKLDPPPNRRGGDKAGEKQSLSEKRGRKRGSGGSRYSLEQALSENAQLHTIAFNGLAFLTGDFGAATFIPPGKVCDFFGFQYMRDIDAAHKGHNPMFLSRVAGNIAQVLNDEQKGRFAALAEEQMPQLTALAQLRLPVIKAFYRQRDGDIPAGSAGLNQAAVIRAVGDIFAQDAELSRRRAEVMAQVYLSLLPDQKTYLSRMKFGDFRTWPALDETEAQAAGRGRPEMFNVAYMTYLSEFFSWTAGSVKADTYFCPERHGTYFGGFYMKDMPAMGKRNYDISTSVTGDSGQAFLEQVLTPAQRQDLEAIPARQRQAMEKIVAVRRAISRELRKYLEGPAPDRARLAALGRLYGELDGEVSWLYATTFARINRTLTDEQRAQLLKLRNLDGYVSAPYYIYSDPARSAPELGDTDAFFYPPQP